MAKIGQHNLNEMDFMLTATKSWECFKCGREIKPGDRFEIRAGEFECETCSKERAPANANINKLKQGGYCEGRFYEYMD